MIEQLLIVQSKLQRIDRLYAINALRGDMLEVLKIKKEELSNYIRVNNYKNRNSVAENSHLAYYLLEIMQLVTLSRGFVDLYNEYSHSEVNIINISECIQKLNDLLRFAILYENNIYGIIYPLVHFIEDMIRDTSGNLDQLSKLVFTYTKRELTFSFYKIEQNVGKLTERFKRNKSVVGMLKGVRKTCIAVFD